MPQAINITASFLSTIVSIILSVNSSHPWLACDAGVFSLTLRIVFKSRTPCFAHFFKSIFSILIDKSLDNSLIMFFNDGGYTISSFTENANDCL